MTAYLLLDTDSAMPAYFSLEPQKDIPVVSGCWTDEAVKALAFLRQRDADLFRSVFLAHLPHVIAREVKL